MIWSACNISWTIPRNSSGEAMLVVGAGDSAIENALALSQQNDVCMVVTRGKEFSRAKEANLNVVIAAITDPRRVSAVTTRRSIKSVSEDGCRRRRPCRLNVCGADGDRHRRRCNVIASSRASGDSAARLRGNAAASSSRTSAPTPSPSCRRHLREQCAGHPHHRLAGGLSADQAGDEPGLRRGGVHQRQRREAGRPSAARISALRPAVRALGGSRDLRALQDPDPDVSADEPAGVPRAGDREPDLAVHSRPAPSSTMPATAWRSCRRSWRGRIRSRA